VLRTRATLSASTAGTAVGSKRPRSGGGDEDADDGAMVEVSYHPEVGDLLLIAPRTARSLSGGRVSITMWWQLSDAAVARRAAEASGPTVPAAAPSSVASSSSATASHIHAPDSAPARPLIYDGVLSPSTCTALSAMPPVRFNIYDRSFPPSNAHEVLIESLLVPLHDASRYIEYWGRQAWCAVPAHSDLDEVPLLAPPVRAGGDPPRPRFPLWAHVVYLDVAHGVAAPTVLWDDDHARSRRVVVVPAVRSRLLRFGGSWVHAVPKPAAEYLGEEQDEADEASEEARGGVLRHVLLFNSWPDAPPDGQPSRPVGTAGAGPVTGPDPSSVAAGGSREPAAADGLIADGLTGKAAPFDRWRQSSIVAHGGPGGGRGAAADGAASAEDARQSTTAFVARLMGGPRRRGRSERYRCDALIATRTAVLEALDAPATPSSFRVQ
jgi:hypothetical protein